MYSLNRLRVFQESSQAGTLISPNVKDPPVLACDHPLGRADGHDRPHMLNDVLDPSRLHTKRIPRYIAWVRGGVTPPTDVMSSAGGECWDGEAARVALPRLD